MAQIKGRMKASPSVIGYLGGDIYTLVENEVRDGIFLPAIQQVEGDAVFVEVGVFLGGNLVRVAKMIEQSGKNIKLIGIDNFSFWNISDKGMREGGVGDDHFGQCQQNIKKSNADAHLFDCDSVEAAQGFEDESIDLIFLDGDHGQEYVARELDAWIPKVKTGGIISGHDFYCEGIRTAVYERFDQKEVNVICQSLAYWTVKK